MNILEKRSLITSDLLDSFEISNFIIVLSKFVVRILLFQVKGSTKFQVYKRLWTTCLGMVDLVMLLLSRLFLIIILSCWDFSESFEAFWFLSSTRGNPATVRALLSVADHLPHLNENTVHAGGSSPGQRIVLLINEYQNCLEASAKQFPDVKLCSNFSLNLLASLELNDTKFYVELLQF